MEATLPSDSPQLHSPGALELKLWMVFFSALQALEHQARPELFKKNVALRHKAFYINIFVDIMGELSRFEHIANKGDKAWRQVANNR